MTDKIKIIERISGLTAREIKLLFMPVCGDVDDSSRYVMYFDNNVDCLISSMLAGLDLGVIEQK